MPPPRPPAPTLSFNKRQNSEDDMPVVSIRFNKTQFSDDDDNDVDVTMKSSSQMDTSVTSQLSSSLDSQQQDKCAQSVSNMETKIEKQIISSQEAFNSSDGVKMLRRSATADIPASGATNSEVKPSTTETEAKTRSRSTSGSGHAGYVPGKHGKHLYPGVKNGSRHSDHSAQSAPVSQVTTPQGETSDALVKNSSSTQERGFVPETSRDYIPQMSQISHDEEKSLFSGFKEKLQDRFHDNINAVIEKIEEISGESSIGEALEKRLRKSDSLDSNKSYASAHSNASSHHKVTKKEGEKGDKIPEKTWSRDNSTESDVFEPLSATEPATKSHVSLKSSSAHKLSATSSHVVKMRHLSGPEGSSQVVKPRTPSVETFTRVEKHRTPSMEFADDFYAEAAEDYFSSGGATEKHSVTKSKTLPHSSNGHSKHSRLSMFKSSKHKAAPPPPIVSIETSKSVPVSMSALLSHSEKFSSVSEDSEKSSLNRNRSREYYDPEEDGIYKDVKTESQDDVKTELSAESTQDKKSKSQSAIQQQSATGAETVQNVEPGAFIEITQKRVVIGLVLVAVYIALPLPSFISGLVCGAVMATFGWLVFQWVSAPAPAREAFVVPDIRSLPPLTVPRVKASSNDETKFKGWMNELGKYDPDDYHITNTKSVYVQLEGSNLRLQTPKQGVPKRAMWNDQPITNVSFMKQRHFDLAGSKVELLPPGLVRKRLWSKKYPICIVLKKKGKKKIVKDIAGAKAMGFEVLPHELCEDGLLFLFARTGREKEEWFRRFEAATTAQPLPTQMAQLLTKLENQPKDYFAFKFRGNYPHSASVPDNLTETSFSSLNAKHSSPSFESGMSEMTMIGGNKEVEEEEAEEVSPEKNLLQYLTYMSDIMPAETIEGKSVAESEEPEGGESRAAQASLSSDAGMHWVNAALGRLFLDFLREQYWAGKVKDKIEKKLSKIHVPYFIDRLTVTDIDLGSQMPIIQRSSSPYLDDRGLWFDLDIAYSGGFQMTLETKVNLMKLKRSTVSPPREEILFFDKKSAVTNSDEEDSAESSTDEEAEEETTIENGGIEKQTQGTSKKFLKLVDKIAASRYFQQATENKYVKKAMEGVSNTKLILTVEIESCTGTVALNIPPPPTDRIWFGFRTNPKLVLSAKPRIGHRDVSLTHITDWIEKKLASEFQRVLVMPNMEDVLVSLMLDPAQARTGQQNGGHQSSQQVIQTTPQDDDFKEFE